MILAVLASTATAAAAPVPLDLAGSSGPGAGQLEQPQDLDVDAAGNIYVADAGNNRISQFSADGSFVRAFGYGVDTGAAAFEVCTAASSCQAGSQGGAAGQLFAPGGLALDGAGSLFVVSSNLNRVDQFSLAAPSFVRAFGYGVETGAVAFESCDPGSGCLAGIAGAGVGQLNFPTGIAAGPSGSVVVVDRQNHRISLFNPAAPAHLGSVGSFGGGPGQLVFPNDVAVSGANVFVSDGNNNRISRFAAPTTFVHSFGFGVTDGSFAFQTCTTVCVPGSPGGDAGQVDFPLGLDADSSGSLWVADFDNNRISRFATAGPSFTHAFGFGVDTNAIAYEVCTTASGCAPGNSGGAVGQPTTPAGVAVDTCGAVWVAEQTNDRIERFGEPGTQPAPPCQLAAPTTPPSNAFSLGKVKVNAKKGTASLPVEIPGPGLLQLAGKGVKGVSAQGSAIASASTLRLTVRAKGGSAKRLKKKGKLKLTVEVTFTPGGGTANTAGKQVQLRRKRATK